MVRFINQPSAGHPVAFGKDLKESQADADLRGQQQYCPMFQPLAFRDMPGAVMVASVAKSPLELSLFSLIRPGTAAYAIARPVEHTAHVVKREPSDVTSLSVPKTTGQTTADGSVSVEGSVKGDESVESDRASVGSVDNVEDSLPVDERFTITSPAAVRKLPPPLLSQSALRRSNDDDINDFAPPAKRARNAQGWLSNNTDQPQASRNSAVMSDERKLFALLQDFGSDRSQSPASSDHSPQVQAAAHSEINSVSDNKSVNHDDDEDEINVENEDGKKVLRNATDENVVTKLYGSDDLSWERIQLIGQMPVCDLNTMMQQAGLSEAEASLVRDIRRRSKNKVAARNCRKRKLDTISHLEMEVRDLSVKRQRLQQERDRVRSEAMRYKQCVHALRRFIVKSLRKEAAATLANAAAAGDQLLDDATSDLLLAVSGGVGFGDSQADLFSSFSAPEFGSSNSKQSDILADLSAVMRDSSSPMSLPADLLQAASPAETPVTALNRYASVSSLATEPASTQFTASSSAADMYQYNSQLTAMAHSQFTPNSSLIQSTDADPLTAALFPAQPAFTQIAAPMMPFAGTWNAPMFY